MTTMKDGHTKSARDESAEQREKMLAAVVAAAARESDLDAAVALVQAALGQDDGGPAGLYFSGRPEGEWELLSEGARVGLLSQYVLFEEEQAVSSAVVEKACAAARALVEFANANGRINLTGKLAEAVRLAREFVERDAKAGEREVAELALANAVRIAGELGNRRMVDMGNPAVVEMVEGVARAMARVESEDESGEMWGNGRATMDWESACATAANAVEAAVVENRREPSGGWDVWMRRVIYGEAMGG